MYLAHLSIYRYVNGLEDKVERLETFLKTVSVIQFAASIRRRLLSCICDNLSRYSLSHIFPPLQICPNVDLNSQLGPPVIRDSWKSDFANSSPSGSRKVSPSSTYAVRSTSQHTGLSSNPANVIDLSSAISFHHHKHSSITESSFGSLSDDEDEEPVGGRPLTLVQEIGLPNIHPLTLAPTHASIDLAFQFTGRSSNYHLASQVRRIKENYIVEARHESAERSEEDDAEMQHADAPIRRQEFWSRPPVRRLFISI